MVLQHRGHVRATNPKCRCRSKCLATVLHVQKKKTIFYTKFSKPTSPLHYPGESKIYFIWLNIYIYIILKYATYIKNLQPNYW